MEYTVQWTGRSRGRRRFAAARPLSHHRRVAATERRNIILTFPLSGLLTFRLPSLYPPLKVTNSYLILTLYHHTVCNGSGRDRIL